VFYAGVSARDQIYIRNDIATDIERYRSLLWIAKDMGDEEYYQKEYPKFNTLNQKIGRYKRENEGEAAPEEDSISKYLNAADGTKTKTTDSAVNKISSGEKK
jgi:hypothetical protein